DCFRSIARRPIPNHCNENTDVKPSFVSSRRILTRVFGDKAKRLCVVSELRLRTWVSVPHRVSAGSRRRKNISTSNDRSQQSLYESLVGTSAGIVCIGYDSLFHSRHHCRTCA